MSATDRAEASRAVVLGCAGPSLTRDERAFFSAARPWGFILFQRNCETPAQVHALVGELRDCLGRDRVAILIDQEGGRVRRLRPPHWPGYPPAACFGRLAKTDIDLAVEAAWLGARLIADDLGRLAITVDCLPCLDVADDLTHQVIGDRAFSSDPAVVARLGRAQAEGLLQGGVLPVIKHVPGHGRTRVDSHDTLPVVEADRASLEAIDFAPFRALSHLPLAMTAHIRYDAVDGSAPATLSSILVETVIRDHIGFDGLLLSDDISMGALGGDLESRSARALAAGCDVVLHCNGDLAEMRAVVGATGMMESIAATRARRALDCLRPAEPFDRKTAVARFRALIAAGEGA